MNWKIERDPFLRGVAQRWGEEAVWEAGFFADDDELDAPLDDVGWLCTPISHVVSAMQVLGPDVVPVVLLATGGFWPPHAGHLAMIEQARAALEGDQGVAIVGGYLSPGHDNYLHMKWGEVAPPAAARISMVEELLEPSSWLAVDPWEALHRRTSVNFTDVVARLQAYLRHHVDERIEVCFVCGGDNARFALAFAGEGRCVVVARPGSEAEIARWRSDPRTRSSPRVRWVDGGVAAASSEMDPAGWCAAPAPSLRLRLEDERVVQSIGLDPERWRTFQRGLQTRLARHQVVTAVPIASQSVERPVHAKLISLDPLTTGTVDLGMSRVFDLGGRRFLGHGERPGHPPVEAQAAAIPPGEYVLLDDDSMTGSTLAFALASLPDAVEVIDVVTLLARSAGEIADSRDFLVGTAEGGLVLRLADGSLGRAPYVLPYVDPHRRCGVEAGDVVAMSIDVWQLNVAAFAATALTVADLPDPARRLLLAAGHGPAELVEDVCRHHADRLASFADGTSG